MAVSQNLSISLVNQNVANNQTTVTITLTSTQTDESFNNNTLTGYYWISVNGGGETQYTFTTKLPQNTTQTCFSVNHTWTHKADGTGSISVRTSLATGISAGTVTTSKSYTPATIPRATTPVLSTYSTYIGYSIDITLNRASSSFTHKLWYKFIGTDWIPMPNADKVETSYTWNIPDTLAHNIPNATSGTGIISVETYNGNTLIGEKRVEFTGKVQETIIPSFNFISRTDPTGLEEVYGGWVRNKSKLKVEVDAQSYYSATIEKVSISVNGVTTTQNPYTTNVLTDTAGLKNVNVTVTDSRGRTVSSMAQYNILEYESPTITGFSAYRCLSDGTEDDEGGYMKVEYAGSITSLNNKNTKTFKVEYKAQNSTYWTTATTYTQGYSVDNSVIVEASTELSYDVRFTATDAFSSSVYSTTVSTAFTLMDFNTSGKGIAFGKVSTQDDFDCNLPAVFRKSVRVESLETGTGRNVDTMLGFTLIGSYTGNRTCTIPDEIWNKAKEFHIEATLTSSDNAWLLQNIPNLWGSATMKISMSEFYDTTYFQNIRFLYGNKQIVPQQGWITGKYGNTTLNVSNLSYSVYYR